MTELRRSPWQGRGMLLLRGEPGTVAAWAHRGLVPVHVVPLDGWTAVLPAGPSHARPPYDDPLKTLAGRPVASRLRSSVGLFAVGGNVVVSAHRSGLRAVQRWVVWCPGEGVVQPRRLAAGRPGDLTGAVGIRHEGVRRGVRDILVDGGSDAHGVLGGLLEVLSLPGFDLLDRGRDPATAPGSILVEPNEQHVARFDRIINDEARRRVEMEED